MTNIMRVLFLLPDARPAVNDTDLLRQRLQGSSKTAFMTCCFVLMDNLLVSNAVDRRHGRLKYLSCQRLVACLDRLANSLDRGTQRRTLAGVVGVLLDCLTSTLARLCGICHEYFLRRNRTAFAKCETKFCKAANYIVFWGNDQRQNFPQGVLCPGNARTL